MTRHATEPSSQKLKEALSYVRQHIESFPSIAIVLGSGLGEFADRLPRRSILPTAAIPHYPRLTVEGHKGRLVFGRIRNKTILAFQGRIHFYESDDLPGILFPIHLASKLGVRTLLVTNAAGGVNRQFRPGDLMLITDQINLTFENPFLPTGSAALPSRTNHPPYDERIQQTVLEVAAAQGILLRRGVYCGVKGPSYETASEIEMIRRIGGDAVGMSTVNEVSLAARLGMRVGGISCITNLATGIGSAALSHSEVTQVAARVKRKFTSLLRGVLERLPR